MKKIKSKRRTLRLGKETLLKLESGDLLNIRAGVAARSCGGPDTLPTGIITLFCCAC